MMVFVFRNDKVMDYLSNPFRLLMYISPDKYEVTDHWDLLSRIFDPDIQ